MLSLEPSRLFSSAMADRQCLNDALIFDHSIVDNERRLGERADDEVCYLVRQVDFASLWKSVQ
jgi:hypothetical protein